MLMLSSKWGSKLGNRTAGAVNQKNGTDELMDDTFQERSLNASASEASDESGNEDKAII
jgi:hypothetical protein